MTHSADRQEQSGTDLVYGMVSEHLVFMPRAQAEDLASLERALAEAATWGEFRSLVSPERHTSTVARMIDNEQPVPADADRFDSGEIAGYEDGDWPEWPAQEMLALIPEDVRRRYGRVGDSTLNGEFLELDPARRPEIVAELESRGFSCTDADDLVRRASGHES